MSSLFLTGAYWHITNWEAALAKTTATGTSYPDSILITATILLLVGGASLLLGYMTRIGVILLVIEIILTAIIFNNFWNFKGAEMQLILLAFLARIALCGRLLILLGTGPGTISIDFKVFRKDS